MKETDNNKRAAVLGWPVSHSLSPRLHNYWLNQYGISGSYEAIATLPEQLEYTLNTLPEQNFSGVNLTIPHKEKALFLMDEVDAVAARIGAVNTVIWKDAKRYGANTDAYGFMRSLNAARKINAAGMAMILGAGGGARAVCAGLLDAGWNIRLGYRNIQKAKDLKARLGETHIELVEWKKAGDCMSDIALLVNTTPLGMKGQPDLDIPMETLAEDAYLYDIVYAPKKITKDEDPTLTEWLIKGKTLGHPVISGLGMLLYQAQPAFHAWFGFKPEVTPELYQYMREGLQ